MDEKLLGDILTNLLSNKIKYFPDERILKFNLLCQDGQAVFEIQDWRIGIPEEHILCLLELFYDTINVGNILSTGLGMAI